MENEEEIKRCVVELSREMVIAIVPAWLFVHIWSCQQCVMPSMFYYLEMVYQNIYVELLLFLVHFWYCIATILKRINVVGMLHISPNTNGVAIIPIWSSNGHYCA